MRTIFFVIHPYCQAALLSLLVVQNTRPFPHCRPYLIMIRVTRWSHKWVPQASRILRMDPRDIGTLLVSLATYVSSLEFWKRNEARDKTDGMLHKTGNHRPEAAGNNLML